MIVSTASAVVGPTGVVTVKSSLVVGDATVAGQRVDIGPAGLELPGSTVPLPTDSPVIDALRQAKVSVTYLEPVAEQNGVISAGLEISSVQPIPDSNAYGTVSYVIGQAEAHAGGSGSVQSTSPPTSAAALLPSSASPAPPPGTPVPAPITRSSSSDTSVGPTDPSPVDAGPQVAATQAAATQAAVSQSPTEQAPSALSPERTAVVSVNWTLAVYLLLALAALVALVGGTLTRYIGVRMPWGS